MGVLIIYYATRFLGDGMKILTKIFLIIIVLLTVMTILVFKDIQMLKEEVATRESTFILSHGEQAYAAIGIKPVEEEAFSHDSFVYYSAEELDELIETIGDDDSARVTKGRVFILTPSALNKSYRFDLGVALDENDLLRVLLATDAYKELAASMSSRLNMTEEGAEHMVAGLENSYGDEAHLKGYLLAALVINYFQPEGLKLAKHIKSRELRVVPETITFKAIRYVPLIGLE